MGAPVGYPGYDSQGSNVTVVYPPSPPAQVVYVEPPRPVIHEYDWSSGAATSPVYLIALKDGTIYGASSYRVEAGSFQFVTLDGKRSKHRSIQSTARSPCGSTASAGCPSSCPSDAYLHPYRCAEWSLFFRISRP
jgi:hypothetical protein